jgi:hypothetical protein
MMNYLTDTLCNDYRSLPMPRIFLTLLLGLFSTGAAPLEITLLTGNQGGGDLEHIDSGNTLRLKESSGRALILGVPYSADQELELFYSQQHTRLQGGGVPPEDLLALDVHTLHLGGTVLSEKKHGLQAFLSGGLGLSHFSPSLGGAAAVTRPSLSLGVGARWMSASGVGLRLESRFYGTLFNNETTVFCSGGCRFTTTGDLLSQYALLAGLVVRFD